MKPFNIEEAKKGAKVCTRDGRKARIICFDRREEKYPIVALIADGENGEWVDTYSPEGRSYSGLTSETDLFMAPEKHEGWINIYKGGECSPKVWQSEQSARGSVIGNEDYITTIKIEWEE